MSYRQIRNARIDRQDPPATLVLMTPDGEVRIPLSMAWAAADLYASLSELVTARKARAEATGRIWQGVDGRYLRAVAALRKADGAP